MEKIKNIEELKAYIAGVKELAIRNGINVVTIYNDSTDMTQYVSINYFNDTEGESKEGAKVYRAMVEGFDNTLETEIRDYDVTFENCCDSLVKIKFTFKQNRRDNTDKYTHGVFADK